MHQISTVIAQNEAYFKEKNINYLYSNNQLRLEMVFQFQSLCKENWEVKAVADAGKTRLPADHVHTLSKNSLTWSPIVAANDNIAPGLRFEVWIVEKRKKMLEYLINIASSSEQAEL